MCCNGRLQSSTVVLLYDARYNVLGRLVKFSEFFYAVLNYLLGPLVHFFSLVNCVWVDDAFDHILHNLVHLC